MQNSETITKGFDILLHSLAPYLAQQMIAFYGEDNWWQDGVLGTLYDDQKRDLPLSGSFGDLVDSLDIANTLRLMDLKWDELFRKKLTYSHRNFLKELQNTRNKWAHHGGEDFSDDDTWRALDTMARMLSDIDDDAAAEIRGIQREYRYGSASGSRETTVIDTKSSGNTKPLDQKKASILISTPSSGLPAWRKIIQPHPDVAEGRYKNADFAVDLTQVSEGKGPFEYTDPVEFFNRTYVTDGMRSLLKESILRLAGKGGEPVLQLKTAFGGGKTHSMLAVYHLAKNKNTVEKIPVVKKIINDCGLDSLPEMHVAVLNGTSLDPTKKRIPNNMPGISINTMWGEMAYQLALSANKPELYDIIKESDKRAVSPGNKALAELFDQCGTCVILIDELVAYARKLYTNNSLPAGTFGNFLTFVQELTEAAKISKSSLVIASIPESDIEIGGEAGQKALESIEHTFGRVESVWKPVGANEGFEIVRRRLFLECTDTQARDEVCKHFSELYLNNPEAFPVDCKEVEYRQRLVSCYPFHPSLFDLLYNEWATLEHFHKTRGVLRLMAALVHNLWVDGDNSLMIMPGSLTLSDSTVRDELLRYLGGEWNSIIDNEIDGKHSVPYEQESLVGRYGGCMACRRVTRTIMLGSAPSTKNQNLRGIEKSDIMLGVAQPGENISIFADALSTLQTKLTYLYSNADGNRFWFDTRPTLRKTAADRASQISLTAVNNEITRRLQSIRKGDSRFSAIYTAPHSSYDVPDEQSVRLVLLDIDARRENVEGDNPATRAAEDILNNRGNSPRIYKNSLVFIAPSSNGADSLKDSVRQYLAWNSIRRDADALNLDNHQIKDTDAQVRSTDQTVSLRISEAYCWLLVPRIEKENLSEIVWDEERLTNSNGTIPENAQKKMLEQEMLIQEPWGPTLLKMCMENNNLWKNEDYVSIKDLWAYLTTYCYLPRILNEDVLISAIERGVESGSTFCYADCFNGKYEGLVYKKHPFVDRYNGILVKLEPALKQIAEDKPQITDHPVPGPGPQPKPIDHPEPGPQPPVPPAPVAKNHNFAVTATLDNTRVVRSVSDIYDEIISQLTNLDGAKVELTLHIEASVKGGFDESTERTLKENCKALKTDDPELF